MTQEDYKRRYENLLTKVKRMRGFQREWSKTHCLSPKEKLQTNRWAHDVDKLAKEEIERKDSQQTEFF